MISSLYMSIRLSSDLPLRSNFIFSIRLNLANVKMVHFHDYLDVIFTFELELWWTLKNLL